MRSSTIYITFLLVSVNLACNNITFTQKINSAWSKLIKSETSEDETENVDTLRKLISSCGAVITITVRLKNGEKVNINSADYEIGQAVDFELVIDWNDINFSGKGWKPKSHDNVYRFLLE